MTKTIINTIVRLNQNRKHQFLQWCCVLANAGWCNGHVKHCEGTQKHGLKQNLESRMRRERKRPSLASPHNAANFLFPHRKWAGAEPPPPSPGEQQLWLQPFSSSRLFSLYKHMYTYTQTHSSLENTHTHTLQANKTRQLWWIYEAAFALRPNRRCLPCWKMTGSQAHILKLNFWLDSLFRSEINSLICLQINWTQTDAVITFAWKIWVWKW